MTRTIFILLLLSPWFIWGKSDSDLIRSGNGNLSFQDSIEWADYYYNIHRFDRAIPIYKKSLGESSKSRPRILKKLALSEAALEHPTEAITYVHDYLATDFEPSFLLHEGFDPIRDDEKFTQITDRVLPKLTVWSIFYFLVGLIGFFVIATLLLNKKIERTSKILIVSFVFIHSLFLVNISTNISNYVFVYPHTYLMSTWASFLYGPLLYLYFKRISRQTEFKRIDYFHFIPTIFLSIYLLGTLYIASGDVKIGIMLERLRNGLSPGDSSRLVLIVLLKTISLILYAFFIHKIIKKISDARIKPWQKNIYGVHIFYIITYTIYGTSIILRINNGFFYHTPLVAMGAMVLFLGYTANVQPDVFSGLYAYSHQLFPKYVKSGLTDSLSEQLKNDLIELFDVQKLYRRNDISLNLVAEKLDTTRHNASQIINEKFKMNFHELVNKYRIDEAKELLRQEDQATIIDIAYEVGYNNKVSFNKAFKRDTNLTPSQYLQTIKENS